ncbi:MAG: hypothetical protein R2713_11450 [Ilumatobacteraceae bacterium]
MGRTAGVSALAVGAAYLAWRLATFGGAPWWLGAPALAVEAIGWLACAILVWALWSRPDPATAHDPGLDGTPVDVEVVVRCLRADPGALRATLLSATPVGPVLVVDPHAGPDLATLAVGFGAVPRDRHRRRRRHPGCRRAGRHRCVRGDRRRRRRAPRGARPPRSLPRRSAWPWCRAP